MNQEMTEELYQTIFKRKSIRKFSSREMTQDTLQSIKDFWEQTEQINPEELVVMKLLPPEHIAMRAGMTYNAPYYIAVYSADTVKGLVNIGYRLQQMDLWLSAHGIASCWLHMMTPDEENSVTDGMPAQITLGIGYTEEALHRSKRTEFKRKNLDQITNGGKYDAELEAVRIAPSGTNSQLWYFEQDESQIRAYQVQNPRGRDPFYKLHVMDMGIALLHLYLSASHAGKFGGFEREYSAPVLNGADYIMTVKM